LPNFSNKISQIYIGKKRGISEFSLLSLKKMAKFLLEINTGAQLPLRS
jgi:hypothetical protein